MSRIRGKDTKPEHRLRRALWAAGLRYRKHAKTPVGRPDIVFPGPRVAVFVDGCFWHGCPDHYVRPRSRSEFWSNKLWENTVRDRRQTLELEGAGWSVVRVWECDLHENEDIAEQVSRVRHAVRGSMPAHQVRWIVVRVETGPTDMEDRHEEDLRDPESRRCTHRKRRTTKRRPRN